MSHKGDVTTEWADGTYTFRLTVAGILELEDKCGAGIAVIAARLISGTYSASDILEVMRIGLIGGGTSAVDAKKLVDRYALPMVENWPIAKAVIGGAMYGFEVSPIPKQTPADQVTAQLSDLIHSASTQLHS